MTDTLQIRGYRPTDHDRVLELHRAALDAAGGYIEGVPEPDLDAIETTYCANGAFLLGELDNRIVAMGAIRPAMGRLREQIDCAGATAELKRLRVDPNHQRSGYGQAILKALERRASELEFDRIVLDTMETQQPARACFESNGYEVIRRHSIRFDEVERTQLLYEKSIAQSEPSRHPECVS